MDGESSVICPLSMVMEALGASQVQGLPCKPLSPGCVTLSAWPCDGSTTLSCGQRGESSGPGARGTFSSWPPGEEPHRRLLWASALRPHNQETTLCPLLV